MTPTMYIVFLHHLSSFRNYTLRSRTYEQDEEGASEPNLERSLVTHRQTVFLLLQCNASPPEYEALCVHQVTLTRPAHRTTELILILWCQLLPSTRLLSGSRG